MIKIKIYIFSLFMILFFNQASAQKIQADSMEIIEGISIVKPGDGTLYYWSWGTGRLWLNGINNATINIRCRQDTCGEPAILQIQFPNETIKDIIIDHYLFKIRNFNKQYMEAGYWYFTFPNDYHNSDICDRNLIIDYIEINQDTMITPPDSLEIGAECILRWDANKEHDLAGYKVYYGTKSKDYSTIIDVGNITECYLFDLYYDIIYYFAVTAYDTANNESNFSKEVNMIFHKILGDCDNSGIVDYKDLRQLRLVFATDNKCFDFNNSNIVDYKDLRKFRDELFAN